MKYDVQWSPTAEQQLAAVYLGAADPDGVTTSADRIDQWLSYKPLQYGQPMNSSVNRVASDGEIGVEYEVIEDDKRVIVQAAFAVRKP